MQLKNNGTCNVQLHYSVEKNGKLEVEYVHIPGGATVELDDKLFAKLCASKTTIEEMELVEGPIEGDVPVKMGKEDVIIKEFYSTGKTREVNLLQERIKRGEMTVVSRPAVSMETINKTLAANHIDPSKLDEEAKLALYEKLV